MGDGKCPAICDGVRKIPEPIQEPMATIELKDEAPVKYVDLTPEKIRKILAEHVNGGKVVEEYALAKGSERVS